jgi:hypothetical protein
VSICRGKKLRPRFLTKKVHRLALVTRDSRPVSSCFSWQYLTANVHVFFYRLSRSEKRVGQLRSDYIPSNSTRPRTHTGSKRQPMNGATSLPQEENSGKFHPPLNFHPPRPEHPQWQSNLIFPLFHTLRSSFREGGKEKDGRRGKRRCKSLSNRW